MTAVDLKYLPEHMVRAGLRTATDIPKAVSRRIGRRNHPVVLMHGFLGFNRIGPIQYFQNVQEYLELFGFPAYAPTADPLNTFEYRGYEWFYGRPPKTHRIEVADRTYVPRHVLDMRNVNPFLLRRFRPQGIAEVFLKHRRKVHLAAHSQACTDARYLLSPQGLGKWRPFDSPRFDADLRDLTIADTVASLTTVAGPHNGVLIADDTHAVNQLMLRYVIPMVNLFISLVSHDESDLWRAAREFGSDYMFNEFNSTYAEHPDVPYRSIVGVTNPYQVNSILRYFYNRTRFDPELERSDNDGFVPLGSARWPVTGVPPRDVHVESLLRSTERPGMCPKEKVGRWTFMGVVYADHIHQIGVPISYPRNTVFKHLPFYLGIVRPAAGEHEEGVLLHPDGRWRIPGSVGVFPESVPLPRGPAVQAVE